MTSKDTISAAAENLGWREKILAFHNPFAIFVGPSGLEVRVHYDSADRVRAAYVGSVRIENGATGVISFMKGMAR